MPTLFDTDTVAPHERFDFWTDSSDRAFFPCTFRRREALGFTGTVRQYLMGPLTVSRVSSAATSVSRTWSDIAAHDPEAVHLSLQLRGRTVFSQHDRQTPVSAGEMVLYDTSHPFSIETDAPYDLVVLECSRLLARPPRPRPRLAPRDAAARRHRADARRAVPHAAGARAGRRHGRRGRHRPRRERRLPAPRTLHRRRRSSRAVRRPATCSRASRSTSRSTWTTRISVPTRSPPRTSCRRAICRSCSRPTA